MISTLNKYIASRVFKSIFVAFLIITSIIMLIDFVSTSRDIGSETGITMIDILVLTALNAPMLVEQTIPFVVLFGVMGALFALNRHSELIVLRASGLSAWRFLVPAMIVTALIGILWVTLFNPLAAMTQDRREHTLHKYQDLKPQDITDKPVWLREGSSDGYTVIHARRSNVDEHKLYDTTFYIFDTLPDGRSILSTRYDAKEAELAKNGFWKLKKVIENENGRPPSQYENITRTTSISWQTLRDGSQTRRKPPFWQIRAEIHKAKQAGFDSSNLIMQFHKLLALPLALIAMAVIAAGASLNMTRSGGTLRLLILGSALGFGVFFIDNLIGAFGKTGTLPPALAAWSVPLLVLFCGLAFLSWVEDG